MRQAPPLSSQLWQETMTVVLPAPPRKKVIHCWLAAVQHGNEKEGNGKGKHFVGFTGKKMRERPMVLASAEGTHHARCTRTRIAHARTQQNHGEWGTLSPLASKASAHRECHGGAFQSSTKGFLWQRGSCNRGGGNNTAEGLAPHATSPRLLVVVPRLHVVVACWHGHLLVVLHCFCSF